jgi:hypothetical protein
MSGPDSIRLRLMLRGADMPQWRNKRKYAAESDVRRMYLRGRQRTLKVDVLPLEQALAQAKTGPKDRPAKPSPLGVRTGVVAVTAAEIKPAKAAAKREKRPWSVGHSNSGSVLRPKPQPKRAEKKSPARIEKPASSMNVAPKLSARALRRLRNGALKAANIAAANNVRAAQKLRATGLNAAAMAKLASFELELSSGDERSSFPAVAHAANLSSSSRRNTTEHPAGSDSKRAEATAAKHGSTKPKRSSAKFDGQPKWEKGIRIVQGGLPELGRR